MKAHIGPPPPARKDDPIRDGAVAAADELEATLT